MNKNNNRVIIFVIVLFSLLALLVTLVFIKLLNVNKSGSIFNENYNSTKVIDQDIDEMLNLDIESEVADINIGISNDDKMHVVVYNYETLTGMRTVDDTLELEVKSKKCFLFCINQIQGKIEILLPNTYSKEITIKSDVGDIEIEDFNETTFDINSNVGDVRVDTAKSLTVKTEVGDIKIGKVLEYTKLKSNVGDIKVKSLNIIKNSYMESEVGDITVDSINDIYVDTSTSVGKAKVNTSNRKSDITLKVSSSVGDIEIG